MKWTIPVVVVACAVIGAAILAKVNEDSVRRSVAPAGTPIADADPRTPARTALDQIEQSLEVTDGSRRSIGAFALSGARTLRSYVAVTNDGKSCLISDDSHAGAGATCVDGGLFDERPVLFSVDSQGGPERFQELYLSGIAAPGIAGVVVTKTDGTSAKLRIGSTGAFLFRSSPADLARDVLPTGMRLNAPDGTLVEVVDIPALR